MMPERNPTQRGAPETSVPSGAAAARRRRASWVVRVLVALTAVGSLTATACTTGSTQSAAPPSSGAGPADDASGLIRTAERIQQSVVSVQVRRADRRVAGSGFRVAIPGIIVTSAHIVHGADEVSVILRGGGRRAVRVLGSAPRYDIAALQVDDSGLPPLHSGSGLANARVGDPVLAIGHRHGRADAVTSGRVRSLHRPVRLADGAAELRAVWIDTAITPGSSGGPLVNTRGEVLGVLTAVAAPRVAADAGITFAIPVDVARREALRIVDNAQLKRRAGHGNVAAPNAMRSQPAALSASVSGSDLGRGTGAATRPTMESKPVICRTRETVGAGLTTVSSLPGAIRFRTATRNPTPVESMNPTSHISTVSRWSSRKGRLSAR